MDQDLQYQFAPPDVHRTLLAEGVCLESALVAVRARETLESRIASAETETAYVGTDSVVEKHCVTQRMKDFDGVLRGEYQYQYSHHRHGQQAKPRTYHRGPGKPNPAYSSTSDSVPLPAVQRTIATSLAHARAPRIPMEGNAR